MAAGRVGRLVRSDSEIVDEEEGVLAGAGEVVPLAHDGVYEIDDVEVGELPGEPSFEGADPAFQG